MNEIIGEKVIGQKEAVEKVVKAIQRNRAGSQRSRPTYRFIYFPWTNWSWQNSIM